LKRRPRSRCNTGGAHVGLQNLFLDLKGQIIRSHGFQGLDDPSALEESKNIPAALQLKFGTGRDWSPESTGTRTRKPARPTTLGQPVPVPTRTRQSALIMGALTHRIATLAAHRPAAASAAHAISHGAVIYCSLAA